MQKEGLKVERLAVDSLKYMPFSERDIIFEKKAYGEWPLSDNSWDTADSSQQYFRVTYHLTALTDRLNIDRSERRYLLQSDLSEANPVKRGDR